MKDSVLYYSVGALLYSPANNATIYDSIVNQHFGTKYSLALCLEDTIRDDCVQEAQQKLIDTLRRIHMRRVSDEFFVPKIFIRVRSPFQIGLLYQQLGEASCLVTGFILPKFSLENADAYLQEIIKVNETALQPVYTMPIYESASIIDLRSRFDILYALKDKLSAIEDRVLNIRVGGNDLCHMFGFRRHETETIHQIQPVASIFSDIITVYGMDYVVSGPVWEYYNGPYWKQGLLNEIAMDRLCGFVGKTVIHPNQIDVVNDAYKVPQKDYADACAILNWDHHSHLLVSANSAKERMNEYKTHSNWALRTLLLAESFGVTYHDIPDATVHFAPKNNNTIKIPTPQVQPYLYRFKA